MFADENPQVRVRGATALGEIGPADRGAVPHLIEGMKDEDWRVRKAAALALDHIRWQLQYRQSVVAEKDIWPSAAELVPPLTDMLADKNDEVRHVTLFCLIRIGPPARSTLGRLIALYWRGTPQDRADTLSALESIDPDDEAACAVFVDALKSPDPSMRIFAVGAMSAVKFHPAGRGIVAALAKALEDKAPNVRIQAAYGLELIGSDAKDAVPALIKASKDKDEVVRRHAGHAIEVIVGERATGGRQHKQ